MEGRYERHPSERTDSPATSREIGLLTQRSAQESHFIGSSSGVYFVNTVKQAFATSGIQSREDARIPTAEETVGAEEDFEIATRAASQEFRLVLGPHQNPTASSANLGPFPDYENAQKYAIEYFTRWHPLFPFLCGPIFLKELHRAYRGSDILSLPGQVLIDRTQLCNLIIIRCVLMIGAQHLPTPDSILQENPSRSHLLSTVCMLASRHDLLTLQTVLAAQLYCISTLALRTASTLSGMLARLLVHAGLHRCPYRYDLTEAQRNLRKRIFWSSFTLDRYLCVSLGIPVALVDSDIDVCVSGRKETHAAWSPSQASDGSETYGTSDSGDQTENVHHVHPDQGDSGQDDTTDEIAEAERGITGNREETLACLVEFGKLVGRTLELFHKSIHIRHYDPEDVIYLRSDVEKWHNGLPDVDSLKPSQNKYDGQIKRFLPFFHVLYERMIIVINRPALSIPRSLPEFHHSLQVTIRAAKNTISGLEQQADLFWPGYLATVWMSGLILSFASQIGLYNVTQASSEVQRCLTLLSRMGKRWDSVKHCHAALSILHDQLRQPQRLSSNDQDIEGPRAKRKRGDAASSNTGIDDTVTFNDAHGSLAEKAATNPISDWMTTGQDFTAAQNLDLDVNDIFQDLSWDNLFESGACGAHAYQDGFLFEY